MASCTVVAGWREVPDGDCELSIEREEGVVNGQMQPLVPGTRGLEGLVGSLCVDSQGLAIGKDLGSDKEFRRRTGQASACVLFREQFESAVYLRFEPRWRSSGCRNSVE